MTGNYRQRRPFAKVAIIINGGIWRTKEKEVFIVCFVVFFYIINFISALRLLRLNQYWLNKGRLTVTIYSIEITLLLLLLQLFQEAKTLERSPFAIWLLLTLVFIELFNGQVITCLNRARKEILVNLSHSNERRISFSLFNAWLYDNKSNILDRTFIPAVPNYTV